MQSTLTARDADPHDTFLIEPNVVLAARADAADANRREPDLRALVSEISAGVAAQTTAPKVDTSFRAAHVERKRGKWAGSFIVAFLFALMSAVGAAAWQRYGDTAQAYVATAQAYVAAVAPVLGLSSSQAPAPTPPADAPAAAAGTDEPAGAAPAPVESAVASVPVSPDQAQAIQSLSRDLAAMGQQVEALKLSIAELKASQEQLTRDVRATEAKANEAKALEQNMRAKISTLPPHPPAAPVRKPRPYVPPVQASVAPLLPPPGAPGSVPAQIAPPPPPPPAVSAAPQDEPVIRPPMPVR